MQRKLRARITNLYLPALYGKCKFYAAFDMLRGLIGSGSYLLKDIVFHLLYVCSDPVNYKPKKPVFCNQSIMPKLVNSLLKRRRCCLIILDAARYDYFESEYHDFLDGKLLRIYSPASNTPDWLKSIFYDFYDVYYFSTGPFVNRSIKVFGYEARKHFKRIIEVWKFGTSKKLNTVHPRTLNNVVLLMLSAHRINRLIVHYAQPHYPYIGGIKKIDPRLPPTAIISAFLRHPMIIEDIRDAYRENLRLGLKYAAELSTQFNGEVIITADHGELLGEYGILFHPPIPVPELREVPWLEVK